MRVPNLGGVVPLIILCASAGARAQAPAPPPPDLRAPSSGSTPSTNSAWFSRAWQSDEGLPGNTVVGVAQTPDGFLWVATESGLVRFDGVRFQETAPSRNPTTTFLADHRGRLWLGRTTAKGGGEVVCLDTGHTRLLPRPVRSLVEDGEGAVWTASGGVAHRIQGDNYTFFSREAGLPSGSGRYYLTSDSLGQVWFACRNQVGVFRDGRFRPLLTLNEPCDALSGARSGGVWIGAGTRVLKYTGQGEPQDLGELATRRPDLKPTVLCEDRRGRLWVGTAGAGLLLYQGAGFDEVALAKREILCLTEDREGSLWVGTRGGGLVRVRPRAFELQTLSSEPSADGMRSLCQDASATLWAVTQTGRLARKEGPVWRALSAQDGWSGPAATCVTAAPKGGVWVGTQNAGLRWWRQGDVRALTQQDGLASPSVTALLTTPAGDVWLGTLTSNAVQRLRDSQFQTLMLPQTSGHFGSLAVDASGGVWVATVGGLLARVSQEALVDQTTNTLRAHHPIASLCATPDGSLWIGYQGLGVGRFKQGRFTQFGTEQGLRDDYIMHILADGRGRLWFAANRGLFSVAEKDFEAVAEGRQERVRSVVYGLDEGVPVSQACKGSWPGALRSTDGRLWIPVVSGLLMVDPSRLPENREPPPVVIERVVVDGQSVAVFQSGPGPKASGSAGPLDLRQPKARLCLPPGPRQVELEYTGLSFVAPRNMAFKYRLEGLAEDWVEAGARRVAYYSHLPPGDYHFEVMACNEDGVWSQEAASLALTVWPHFWETWWFLGTTALAALGAAGETARRVARRRTRQHQEQLERTRALERERIRIAQDMHDDLGSRLTRLAHLGTLTLRDSRSFEEMKAHLGSLTDQVRELINAMDEVVWTVRPENDSLPNLAAFLSDYTERFLAQTGIRHRLELDPEFPALPVTAEARHNLLLAAKEVLNNAVRHGAPKLIRLKIHALAGWLEVVVSDDGQGFAVPPARARGHGLANVAERMTLIKGSAQFASQAGQGTTVTLLMPLAGLPEYARGTSFVV